MPGLREFQAKSGCRGCVYADGAAVARGIETGKGEPCCTSWTGIRLDDLGRCSTYREGVPRVNATALPEYQERG